MKTLRILGLFATSLLVLSTLRAQDAKIVTDNLEFSREFYSGVHFSAIASLPQSFAYDRYPDDGPERIRCDEGTFARRHGKPWLKSQDWGESGRPVDKQTARKLDTWVKLVEAALSFAPTAVKLVDKSEAYGSVQWTFEARTENQKGFRLEFAKAPYDKNPNALLHDFEGSLRLDSGKPSRAERVKFSFGYLISVQRGYEFSERAWEDLQMPREEKNKPLDLSKFEIGPKPSNAEGFLNRGSARRFNGDRNGAIADFSRAIELDSKSVSAIYNRGITRLQKGDYEGAIADLSRAIDLSPNTADYYNDRGLAKLRKGDNDGALADFTRAIELDPKSALAYRNRALAKDIKKDADGALADYNRAIELDPKNASAFNNRGNIKKAKGDLDGAIADFTSAIGLNDKLAIAFAYKNRGEAKQAKGDADGAKEDLKRAGELDPELMSEESRAASEKATSPTPSTPAEDESVADLVNGGIEKGKNGDVDGAIADFNRAIELDPKDDAPYFNRAQAKWLKKDAAGAVADYTKAIELGSTNPAAYNNRGNARVENDDLDGAIADYTRAIELKPDYARAYYNRATVKRDKGDAAGADADFKEAKKLDPELAREASAGSSKTNRRSPSPAPPGGQESSADLVNRGIEKAKKGDLNAALLDFYRAVQRDPKNAVAYYNRAYTKWLKQDATGALADYTRAIELDPKYAEAYFDRGNVKGESNDPDGAIADFNRAIEIKPDYAIAYHNHGVAKKEKGDTTGAEADFKTANKLDPELANEQPTTDSKNNPPSAATSVQPTGDTSEANLVEQGIEKGRKDDLDGAIADFDRAIELDPRNAVAYYNRGHAKWVRKDTAAALADCSRAIELDPKCPEAYFERGTLRGRIKDSDGAIADLTRAIELKPDYVLAYYNRGIAKKAKGDQAGADADFKSAAAGNKVSLLDGKLTIDLPPDFSRDPDDPKEPKTIAKFSGPADGAWGTVLRGTHGLTPEQLEGYLKKRVAEYSKGFKWLPKDSHLQWLKKEIVTIDGRKWADWSFVPTLKEKKDYSHNPAYTRNLATSYKGQLLEINFTSNLNHDPGLKKDIDSIMKSVHLEE